jgi:hypothetical protein
LTAASDKMYKTAIVKYFMVFMILPLSRVGYLCMYVVGVLAICRCDTMIKKKLCHSTFPVS